MSIDIIALTQWLSSKNHGFITCGYILSIAGACYLVPNLFGRRAIYLVKLTQILITSIIGGIAFGVVVTPVILPIALFIRQYEYHKFPAIAPDILMREIYLIFVNCAVAGMLLGFLISFIYIFFSMLSYRQPYSRSQHSNHRSNPLSQKLRTKEMFIGWLLIGSGSGIGFWMMIFQNPIGLLIGLAAGMVSFFLGLHPRPAQAINSGSPGQPFVRWGRMVGFWLELTAMIGIILFYMLERLFIPQPLISLFLLGAVLLFFRYIFWQMNQLSRLKQKARTPSNQSTLEDVKFIVSRVRIIQSVRLGVVSGILIYGVTFGIPIGYIFSSFFNFNAGLIAFLLFCLLGAGFGVACGVVFCYCYNFELIATQKIMLWAEQSDKKLQWIGLIMTITGMSITWAFSLLP